MEVDVDALMQYVAVLENAITIAAEEFRAGDFGYAARVITVMESRIKMAHEAAEAEAAAEAARRHLH